MSAIRRPALQALAHALARHPLRHGGLGLALRCVATFLTFANALTGQLLTPVVSVNLARPRISNARVGTLPFVFAGSAGDIYGRYLGYYFLNIVAWLVAAAIAIASAARWAVSASGTTSPSCSPSSACAPS